MFRFTFNTTYTEKNGKQASDVFTLQLDTDNVSAARAEFVYRLSRNPHVFAPFDFEFEKIEHWENNQWNLYLSA